MELKWGFVVDENTANLFEFWVAVLSKTLQEVYAVAVAED